MRVLIADDDADLRSLICDALKWDGHEVLEACDGPQTLSLLSDSLDVEKKIDVILLDILMPGYSGLGVLAAMRRYSASSMPVVVMMTALEDPSIDTVAKRHGALGVLRKPFDAGNLRSVVAATAGLRRGPLSRP